MNPVIATIFYHPIHLPWSIEPWLLIPLCISVGIVYKTLRTDDLSRLLAEIVKFSVYTLLGLTALCLVAAAIYYFLK